MFDYFDKRCKNRRLLLAQEDKKTLDNYVKNEQKQRHNNDKKSTNTSASTSPQVCPTTTPLVESASMLPTTISRIPLVTKSGRQATLACTILIKVHIFIIRSNYNGKSLEFYYEVL
jgi:hypothetical protein